MAFQIERSALAPAGGGTLGEWLGASLIRASETTAELVLPYREEFGEQHIHRGVVAAFAELAAAAALERTDHDIPPDALHLKHCGSAAAGNELYAHARIANGRAYVEIRTNDDRALLAKATLNVPSPAATTSPEIGDPRDRQAVYPI
jgi:acyl-coenzyme A thioesterase PaaI-like protein